jgi:hypothetical protein
VKTTLLVFNPALEIVHRSSQQLSVDRERFLEGGVYPF